MNRRPFDAAAVGHESPLAHVDISLTTAVVDRIVKLAGDFVYIDQASTGVVSIELNLRQSGTNEPIMLAAGGSIEVPGGFASLKINATAQINKTVRLFVGNGLRIKGGANVNASSMSVSVVDGAKARTSNNQAFLSAVSQSAVVANYSHLQLLNPAGSLKTTFLERIWFQPNAAAITYAMGAYSTAIANLQNTGVSKRIGGAVGTAQTRYEATGGGLIAVNMMSVTVNANTELPIEFTEPIQLDAGQGIVISNLATNSVASVSFEWFEE